MSGTMTVVPTQAPATVNGTGAATQPSLTDKIAAKKAEVERLKLASNKLGGAEEEYAKLCAEENAEHRRLEEEAAARLRQRAEVIEAECRGALPDNGERTELVCLCDRSTEKRTGIGVIVVKAHEGAAAVSALAASNKMTFTEKGEASFDPLGSGSKSKADILNGLLKCTVYPDPATHSTEIAALCEQAYGFALAAYEAASGLTGRHAQRVTGKSTS